MSDVFSGYAKAVRDSNEEAEYYLRCYRLIYRLEKWPLTSRRKRQKQLFKAMKVKAMEEFGGYPAKSALGKALSYLLKNYDGLTRFLDHEDLPIDNNLQERQLRSPVVGRKTWLGTHSPRGSETAAILFTIVESCKLLINTRKLTEPAG